MNKRGMREKNKGMRKKHLNLNTSCWHQKHTVTVLIKIIFCFKIPGFVTTIPAEILQLHTQISQRRIENMLTVPKMDVCLLVGVFGLLYAPNILPWSSGCEKIGRKLNNCSAFLGKKKKSSWLAC